MQAAESEPASQEASFHCVLWPDCRFAIPSLPRKSQTEMNTLESVAQLPLCESSFVSFRSSPHCMSQMPSTASRHTSHPCSDCSAATLVSTRSCCQQGDTPASLTCSAAWVQAINLEFERRHATQMPLGETPVKASVNLRSMFFNTSTPISAPQHMVYAKVK